MTEQDGNKSEINDAAIGRFRKTLEQIPTSTAQYFRDLIGRGLIRLTTNKNTLRAIGKNRSSGIGFSVYYDPKTWSAKAIVAVDPDVFASKGPLSLKGQVRDMLEKFEWCIKIVERRNLEWQFLEDSEVETFLRELESGGGKGYEVLDISKSS